AMVEFALVLPILLTLLYGMMETGRLLFIYASTVTAARQAARYGSATGTSPSGVPYYQDCPGIENAARNLGFINRFDSVTIGYDGGVQDANLTPREIIPNTCGPYNNAQNGDRITVEVVSQWQPIVNIVPFDPITITSSSERTILASVDIYVATPPPDWTTTGGKTQLTISGPAAAYTAADQIVEYIYTITNIGTTDAKSPVPFSFTMTGDLTLDPATCSPSTAPTTLAPGASYVCKGYYTIKQADVDRGYVDNQISSVPKADVGAPATTRIYAAQNPALTIVKSADKTATTTSVTYTYTLKNTGNVTLLNYTITDDKLGLICSGAKLAPGATAPISACYRDHAVTPPEKNDGFIVNTATAAVSYNKYDQITDSAAITSFAVLSNQVTVLTTVLSLIITPSPTDISTLPQTIGYTFKVINNTAAPLSSPNITIMNFTGDLALFSTITCPGSVPANNFVSCTATYPAQQPDLDSGLLTLQAQATAGGETSNKYTANVTVTANPQLSLTIATTSNTAWPDVATKDDPLTSQKENEITYTYTVKNTGNVTLLPPFTITDDLVTTGITCSAVTSLAPLATMTCSGLHAFTTTELDNFSFVVNTATASATRGGTPYSSAPATAKVWTSAAGTSRLLLTLSAPPVNGEGASVMYTYKLTNTGRVNLTSPFTFTNYTDTAAPTCGTGTITIPPGGSIDCIAPSGKNYKTTELDVINAKAVAQNVTAASGTASSTASAEVTVGPNLSCNVKFSSFSASTSKYYMSVKINNNNAFTLRLLNLEITYPNNKNAPPNQYVLDAALNGTVLWTNSSTAYTSPLKTSDVNNNVPPPTIAPNSQGSLQVNFVNKNVNGGTKQIIIRFSTPGCETVQLIAQ
ncbi:MAG: TadE/TadG family type IV pilus assembly protein, partial [Anaerolineales bacterium]|nr:TadE/TadG family type IV pilus assembly protein [Anaerolineales bacterium]